MTFDESLSLRFTRRASVSFSTVWGSTSWSLDAPIPGVMSPNKTKGELGVPEELYIRDVVNIARGDIRIGDAGSRS